MRVNEGRWELGEEEGGIRVNEWRWELGEEEGGIRVNEGRWELAKARWPLGHISIRSIRPHFHP